MSLSETQRRAILVELQCPIMGAGLDHEIADDHEVSSADVRALRAELRAAVGTQEVRELALEYGARTGLELPLGALIASALRVAVSAAQCLQNEDHGRSAGRVMSGRTDVKQSVGISGVHRPEMTATARCSGVPRPIGRGVEGEGDGRSVKAESSAVRA